MIRTITCQCGYHGEPRILRLDGVERWYCPRCGRNQVDGTMNPLWEVFNAGEGRLNETTV
jgi:hypothetical protein